MQSVKDWAKSHAWDYVFMDDAFLGLAPATVQEVCASNIYALTDVCRLVWAKQALAEGYDRVIWADADMLVFRPADLRIDDIRGHGFAREFFLRQERSGKYTPIEGINNALMVFEQGDDILDSYLQACMSAISAMEPGKVPRTALGPHLLKSLDGNFGLNRIEGIGLFTQAVMTQLAKGNVEMWAALQSLHGRSLVAANLCHFLRNSTPLALREQFDATHEAAVKRLTTNPGWYHGLE